MDKRFWLVWAFISFVFLSLSACSSPETDTHSTPNPSEAVIEYFLTPPEPALFVSPSPIRVLAATPTLTQTSTPGFPESHYIILSGHEQAYPLSCEASAAVDWAAYFGVNIYEYDFQMALPLSDNPDLGFCGDVFTDVWGQIPPFAYGVHAGPVADLLMKYGLPAKADSGWTLEQVKQKLAENKPILVWVIGNMEYSKPVTYIDKRGQAVLVAPYEHAVILTGYNTTTVRYMNNGRFFDIPAEVFLTSWGVLNNMGIVYE